MVWVNPNQPFPGETIRSALSERSYAHIIHVDEEETAESSQPVAAGSHRARELEMVASHASVEALNLPPELIALAYDQNNGELIDTLMVLTEPIFRRQLEHELAERQATEQAEAAEQEEEEEEPEPDQREPTSGSGEPGAGVHARARERAYEWGKRPPRTSTGAHGDARRPRGDGGVPPGEAAGCTR